MSQLSYWKVLTRKKTLTHAPETETKLNRVLRTYDLTALGVGATLGVGVYVLAGHVARDQAGPSVVLSFLIAALASLLAGLCYAEFGARVPKAGSAYIYSYVCIGEFAAFIIGWNLILEYIIGSASVCRGISLYLDTLLNNTLKITFIEIAPIEWGFLGSYFDFFAFGLAIVFGVGLAFGIQTSAFLNNFCTIINVGVVIFVIIAGSIKANIENWQIDPSKVNMTTLDNDANLGVGGFFPFGFEGTLRGAATCFFGFVGFDCIATTGEEVKEPRRAIPRAILFSLLIIFLSYFGVSTVLTLMWPYYLQDVDAPLPYAFENIGWHVAKWIVTIGGMLGLIASLLGALIPLPRIIYAMSQDGLVFRFLGTISPRFKTPVIGSICAAFLTGFFAGLFDLTQLVNMLSIGTLLAYTVIAICLTILRFMDNSTEYLTIDNTNPNNHYSEGTNLVNSNGNRTDCNQILKQIFNLKRHSIPNNLTTTMVTIMLLIYCASSFGFSLTVMYAFVEIQNLSAWALTLLCIFGLINIFIIVAISVQPREEKNPYFKVPLVPLLPAISIFVNIYLMLQLDIYTWIRFAVWMVIGLIIYLPCICLYNRTKSEITTNPNEYVHNSHMNQEFKVTALKENENHSNSLDDSNNELILVNGNAMLNIKSELDDDQNLYEISQTTPKQCLDDIVLESEISNSLREMKHSNGDRYLVEHTVLKPIHNNNVTEDSRISDESTDDTKSVLDILDNVLQGEENETYNNSNRKFSVDSEQIPSFHDVSTAVLIHRSSDCLKEETENEIVNNMNSGSKDSGIDQDTEIESDQKNIALEIENSEDINDPEISMATANTELVDLLKENIDLEPESNIEQVLIPGSNLLINSPRASKSDRKGKDNPILIEETPRSSVVSENERLAVVAEKLPEIEQNDQENSTLSPTTTALPIPIPPVEPSWLNKPKNDANSDKNFENRKETLKASQTQTDPLQENTPKEEELKSNSPKVTFILVPLKSYESPPPTITKSSPTLSRKSSTNSIKAYENPLHSDSFKEKLSKLMGQSTSLKVNIPPPLPEQQQEHKNDLKNKEESFELEPETAPIQITEEKSLKPSKSEADIMRLVLNDLKNQSSNDNNSSKEYNETSNTLNENNIPKPPKFDPILYKSLGANISRHSKDRPKLDEMIGKDSNKKIETVTNDTPDKDNEFKSKQMNGNSEEEDIYTPEQFKKKLAAIIQRGPSYKIQRSYPPADVIGSSKNTSIPNNSNSSDKITPKKNYADVLEHIRAAKIPNSMPSNHNRKNIKNKISSSNNNNNNEQINLENVRKSLKSIS